MSYEHIGRIITRGFADHATRTALKYKEGEEWIHLSYGDLKERIHLAACALIRAGIEPGDRVGIYSANRYEWAITDFACVLAGAVSVPIYATNTREQSLFIIRDAGIRLLFVGNAFQLDNTRALGSGEDPIKIVSYDPGLAAKTSHAVSFEAFIRPDISGRFEPELARREASIQSKDIVTIIYTSGTTGNPKGVMLSHANFLHQFKALDIHFSVTREDVSLCFLPLSHVYERVWSYYVFSKGALNTYLEDPKKVIETLRIVRPTAMVSVPRLYEKIYAAVNNAGETAWPIKKYLFKKAVETGFAYHTCLKENNPISLGLRLKFRILDRLILSKVREIVGGPKNFFSAGGAPLAQSIEEFFFACGLLICQGYGLTETAPMISFNTPGDYKFGTVGKPVPDCEVRIGAQGEVLVRGGQVMAGYFNSPEKTARAIVDGWFKTGDIGRFDRDGFLRITDRIKELIITSGGKNIAPQHIETLVGKDYFIEQIVAIGDGKKFISALVVPAMEALEKWAEKKQITWHSVEGLINRPEVKALYRKRIDLNSGKLARFETIKSFTLLPRPFTVETGEITPTMKLKRKIINEKYYELIESMYQKAVAGPSPTA